jgi:CubicO group peptidase (beta-lactamase class C family)
VLDPLKMNETGIALSTSQKARFAAGHNALGAKVQAWDFQVIEGAGALRSNMADMLRFLAASLDSAHGPLGRIMARTREPQRPADRPGNSVGLGWHIVEAFGTTITWHNGGTGGYRAFIGLDQSRSRGVVILSNSTVSPDDIGFHLLEPKIPLDLPAGPPQQRTEITLAADKLDAFVGVYELAPAFMLTVTREGGMLFGQATGQGKVQLHPESETKFFLREVDALVLHQGGANIPGKKLK